MRSRVHFRELRVRRRAYTSRARVLNPKVLGTTRSRIGTGTIDCSTEIRYRVIPRRGDLIWCMSSESTPGDHRLASREAIRVQEIVGETFISISNATPVLRTVIDE